MPREIDVSEGPVGATGVDPPPQGLRGKVIAAIKNNQKLETNDSDDDDTSSSDDSDEKLLLAALKTKRRGKSIKLVQKFNHDQKNKEEQKNNTGAVSLANSGTSSSEESSEDGNSSSSSGSEDSFLPPHQPALRRQPDDDNLNIPGEYSVSEHTVNASVIPLLLVQTEAEDEPFQQFPTILHPPVNARVRIDFTKLNTPTEKNLFRHYIKNRSIATSALGAKMAIVLFSFQYGNGSTYEKSIDGAEGGPKKKKCAATITMWCPCW